MKVSSLKELGGAMRAVRVALNVPLADLAENLGTSRALLRRLEDGQSTVAVQKLFSALKELGIEVHIALPPKIDESTLLAEAMASKRKRARP